MPYGNPQKLGEGIDPRMFVHDFSAFADAERIKAAGLMNMTDSISGAISDYAKERKDLNAKVKAGDFMMKYAEMEYPDKKEQFAALRNEMANPALSKAEQAAMADSITGMIALGTANDRYAKESAMRSKEFDLRSREADEMSTARKFDISTAQKKQEATQIVNQTLGPSMLQSAIDMMKEVAPERLKTMPDIKSMSPDMQMQIAEAMVLTLPKKQQQVFVEKYPVQGGTLPAYVNQATGKATPVTLDLPLPPLDTPDGSVLPPKPGTEGATYQGVPIIPNESPQDQQIKDLQIQKTKQEIGAVEQAKTEKTANVGAAIAKSERMASLLDQLEKHDGFGDYFGATWKPFAKNIGGTDAAGAATLFKQIDAMGFIEAIKDMKGMGALSNAEGEKVSAALVGMDHKMPEAEARAKISEVKKQIQIGIARQQSGQLVNPDGTPKTSAAAPNSSLLNAWQNRPR